ncbi:helical backbone metal receptor [Haloparvum sp. PAK95]|uniref:helical backbone metal receptor n=1 Tax=Haloparvum sp. PAK95 TaxID=3418962 RepID=UPI003D2F3DBC
MTEPRVVSLAPSATATLSALGAADCLVGVTEHCEVATDSAGSTDPTDPEPPTVVGGWLTPDPDVVERLDPDLILTSDGLQAELADDFRDRGYEVHHREPATLDDAVDGFADLGAAVGRAEEGERLAAAARDRLDAVAAAVGDALVDETPPVVYCEEWSDPPMAAGNWVPDAVRAAGGRYPFVEPGDRSREVDGAELAAADPDHVVLHVCGHGDRVDPDVVRDRGWDLDAPIHVLDDALLNQPSPRLVDGIERLARILHPDAFGD